MRGVRQRRGVDSRFRGNDGFVGMATQHPFVLSWSQDELYAGRQTAARCGFPLSRE